MVHRTGPAVEIDRAIDLINSSRYIRLIDASGIRRISRAAAIEYTRESLDTATMHGWFIYLDGTMGGPIIHI